MYEEMSLSYVCEVVREMKFLRDLHIWECSLVASCVELSNVPVCVQVDIKLFVVYYSVVLCSMW